MTKKQVVLRGAAADEGQDSRSSTSSVSGVRRVRYGMCQKNHAASTGGYALDGCREFIPSGNHGTELALVCAACGCHRNFHRREEVDEVA